ncbi:lipase 1-like [Contarinia nasturtii]|uniref:lipase 1-like n=1 Tax=Contarinia nasturtii TaxID=265458 RepID=UPI0012D42890|nr:lipase 1-like [Contarinia nasturtii]
MDLDTSSLVVTLVHIILLPIASIHSRNSAPTELCGLKTDQLVEYYGYEAETHKVTTEDGYILTIFRCNSKNLTSNAKKSVILNHGLLLSSDDFCIDTPKHALAYILADANYDVWLVNGRGNVYSRNHISKDPNELFSAFWDFSWYEIGVYDLPAVIDYILQNTNNSKTYYVGYSQGTTSALVLLSKRPEYNEKIYAASLMAPAAYQSNDGEIYQIAASIASKIAPILNAIRSNEFLPRSYLLTELINTVCGIDLKLCNIIIDIICGPSINQRNNTMLPVFLCKLPSGVSLKQFIHYGQEIHYGFFGKYMDNFKIPDDFPLSQITIPMSIHYSVVDQLAAAPDVEKLITKLKNSKLFIQRINKAFNHVDFVWSMNAASLIYSKILTFFENYQ